MMDLNHSLVNRPVSILVFFSIVCALGIFAAFHLPMDLFPEIRFPLLVVYTEYPGAGPEQVEKLITRPLEGVLSNASHVRNITSVSSKGQSMITIEYSWGADMDEAANSIRDRLEWIKDSLPAGSAPPGILKLDPAMLPVIELAVEGDRPLTELTVLADERIIPSLEQLPGVSLVSTSGSREKIVCVDISQNRLDAHNLVLSDVADILRRQNAHLGQGTVPEGSREFLVEMTGEYRSLEEISRTVVVSPQDFSTGDSLDLPTKGLYLSDIGNVYEGLRDFQSSVFINGKPGLILSVQKQSGSNSVEVADNVYIRLAELEAELPEDVSISVISDSTELVRRSLKQVTGAALLGALLAMCVLLFFLRNLGGTFIIGCSIPVSLLMTLLMMRFLNLSLNLMTMAGLTLGIGMIVDSSIVVLENISRYADKGTKIKTAAVLGSKEMILAITASTLTSVCIFIPVLLFRRILEIIGILFWDLALTVVISLLASLVVALALVPVLSTRFLGKGYRVDATNSINGSRGFMANIFRKLDQGYRNLLKSMLKRKGRTLLAAVLLFLGSLAAIPVLSIELFPENTQSFVQLEVKLPVGSTLSNTEDILRQFSAIVQEEVSGFEEIVIISGIEEEMFTAQSEHQGTLMITLPPFDQRKENSDEIMEILRAHFPDFPGVDFSFDAGVNNLTEDPPFDIIVKSDDQHLAIEKAEEIARILEDCPEVAEPFLDMENALPSVDVAIDRSRAYALGLDVYSIGLEIEACLGGTTATAYRENGRLYDIVVRLPEADRKTPAGLKGLQVRNCFGRLVPLVNIADFQRNTGTVAISRENRIRAVHVLADIPQGVSLNNGETALRRAIEQHYVPNDNVIVEFAGDYEDMSRYMIKMIGALVLSVLLVFGVMAGLFESFKDPFIILFSIPFLLPGVLLLHLVTGTPIGIFTVVGVIMLTGIVVNNGIVLVDYTNLLRKRGVSVEEACIEAGGHRLRPVLMTSLTTIFGMLPLAFGRGAGADMVRPIGQAIIGGMAVSTVFTLMVVPVLYAVLKADRRKRNSADSHNLLAEFID